MNDEVDKTVDPVIGYREINQRYAPGIPIGTLRAMCSRGEMPPSFIAGRRRVWRESAILAWLDAMERRGAA